MFSSYLVVVTNRKIYKGGLLRVSMKKQNYFTYSNAAIHPTHAMNIIELTEKFKLPKARLKLELEQMVKDISTADYYQLAKEEGEDLNHMIGQEVSIKKIEKILDKAKKQGVEKGLIAKAASNYIKPYITTSGDWLRGAELQDFQKKYAVRNADMYNAILAYYHKK